LLNTGNHALRRIASDATVTTQVDLAAYIFPDKARDSLPAINLKRDAQGESATVAVSV
jgi:hypothetical protein